MNSLPENNLTIDTIVDWLRTRAHGWYGGEVVTQLQHALQCATLARAEGAEPELVVAALLHDIGHVAEAQEDRIYPHGELAACLLKGLFPPVVTEPIRLHVDAKRYLCATDSLYWDDLSDASKKSLAWQGGPFTAEEAKVFIRKPYAADAVRLRRWDEAAKEPGAPVLALEQFVPLMQSVMRRPAASHAASEAA
ncbi:MAG: HD domain-containing protein [Burkholderiales bacterium]|nr:HD domain-containing protein [Burkholderiales bacterium]